MAQKTAIIIGAGPAGLTAALELLRRTDIKPIVLERSEYLGGISRTVCHNGNRMDIGGHRFFSKSDRVMNWWLEQLPRETDDSATRTNDVMLVRDRKSRIYFLRRFFDYPIQLSKDTLRNLGVRRSLRIGFSYLRSSLFRIKPEVSLKDFLINRFGRELYGTFFKSYTEKVWAVPCDQISAEWGAQRIKGLSIRKVLLHIANQAMPKNGEDGVAQKQTETSLIERFLYPKYGPGQMWEKIGNQVVALGGEIIKNFDVDTIETDGDCVLSVSGRNASGQTREFTGDYLFSTTSIKELVAAMQNGGTAVPEYARNIAAGLQYRDFIAVGILVKKLKLREPGQVDGRIADNWIYIQEPDVRVGRLQLFHNWSPYLVTDPGKQWLGAEYFCNEGDDLWSQSDEAISRLAIEELSKIDIIDADDVSDTAVVRMPKTYPAYFGIYNRFGELRSYLDSFPNLFLIGRNGMHKYNNQDHSMLTAMTAVDNIKAARTDKANIWMVNTEQDYHESKTS
jgi:protoporphyrinogen oxidase